MGDQYAVNDYVSNARARSETFKARLRATAGFVAAFAAALTTGLSFNSALTSASNVLAFFAMASVVSLVLSAVAFIAGSVATPPSFGRIEKRLTDTRWRTRYAKLHHGNENTPGHDDTREIASGISLKRSKILGTTGSILGGLGAAMLIALLIGQFAASSERETVRVYATNGQTWHVCGKDVDELYGSASTISIRDSTSTSFNVDVRCNNVRLTILVDRSETAVHVSE